MLTKREPTHAGTRSNSQPGQRSASRLAVAPQNLQRPAHCPTETAAPPGWRVMLAPIPRSKPYPMQSHALRPHVLSEHYAIANAAASTMNADATRTGNKADKADHSTLSARAGIICMTRQPALHKTMRATMRSRTSKNTCRSNNIKQAE